MSLLHRNSDVTAAIIYRLTSAGLVVGDNEAPDNGGWQGDPGISTFVPYVDVHPSPGGPIDGTMAAPSADAFPDYQITSVGVSRAQAELVGDEVREAMFQGPLNVPGRAVIQLRLDMLGGAVRDDTVQPAVFFVSDRYRLTTVPA